MLHMLKERREQNEEGFTLIELMVVVLIIAILLAIAIPTFLGARGSANNRAAESALRNALTAEKTYFTNTNSQYVDSSIPTVLAGIEPAIAWTVAPGAANVNLKTANYVVAKIPLLSNGGAPGALVAGTGVSGTAVLLEAKSATGDCFYIWDDTASIPPAPAVANQVGTAYFRDAKCSIAVGTPPPRPPVPATVLAPSTSTANAWATTF